MSLRRSIKRLVQTATARVAPVAWRWRSPSLLVLMYHRVLPVAHPDRVSEQPGMFVSPDTLAMHLDQLKRLFTLIHLDDWLENAANGGRLPRRACAITFDDGWLDNYQYAWPLLKAAAAPATIYLVSDRVGTAYSFWPNRLARLIRASGIDGARAACPRLAPALERLTDASPQVVEQAIHACKEAHTDAELDGVFAAGGAPVSMARDLMNWEEIREMAAGDQVRFGSHSRRHTRLTARIGADVVKDEVIESARIIEAQLGRRPRTFCFPNGDHAPGAVAAAREAYVGAVTTRRGWNAPRTDRYLLNRVGVHEDVSASRDSFVARLAGVG